MSDEQHMGQQQGKERPASNASSGGGIGLGGASLRVRGEQHRASSSKPRKERGILGSNIFTEHSGEFSVARQRKNEWPLFSVLGERAFPDVAQLRDKGKGNQTRQRE